MIDGISRDVDIGVLMVSMLENEFNASFDKGMLKEHLLIAKFVGIEKLIIIANKMDLIDWDFDIYTKRINKVHQFLTSIQWKSKNIYTIPISSVLGIGLINSDNIPKWYTGKSFLNTLDEIGKNNKKVEYPETILSNNAIVKTFEKNIK